MGSGQGRSAEFDQRGAMALPLFFRIKRRAEGAVGALQGLMRIEGGGRRLMSKCDSSPGLGL